MTDAVFVAALAAPAVAALVVVVAPRATAVGGGVRVVAALAVPLWAVLAAGAASEGVGRLTARPIAAAAACGIAMLVAATKPTERSIADVVALLVVWTASTVAVAAGLGDPSTLPLAVGLAVAAAGAAFATTDARPLTGAVVAAGAALVVGGWAAAGETAAHFRAGAFADAPLGTALALAGVVVLLVGALDGHGPVVVAVPALAAAAVVAPHAAGPSAALAVPVAACAVIAAWFDRRPLAVALVAVAAMAVDAPTGLLAASATTVIAAVPSSPALLTAVPAATALATRATHDPTTASVAVAVAAAAVAVLLTLGRDLRPTTVPLRTAPAARDSAGRTQLSDMRAWVDSAAGVSASPVQPVAVGDTIAAIADSAAGDVVAEPHVREAGVRAPDTATPLPAIALAGLAMLGAGVWLLRRARA
jgi:hypothetical protein